MCFLSAEGEAFLWCFSIPISGGCELPLPHGAAQGAPSLHRSILVTKAALRTCPALPQAVRPGQVPGPGPQPCTADMPVCDCIDGHRSQVILAPLPREEKAGHTLSPWWGVLLRSGVGRGAPLFCSTPGPTALSWALQLQTLLHPHSPETPALGRCHLRIAAGLGHPDVF